MGFNITTLPEADLEVAEAWRRFKEEKHLSDKYIIKTYILKGMMKLYIYDVPNEKIYYSTTEIKLGMGEWAEGVFDRWWNMTGEISDRLAEAFKKQYEK